MRAIRMITALLLTLTSLVAQANWDSTSVYYGLGVGDTQVDVAGRGSRSLTSVSGTLGIRLSPFLGVELQGAMASDDSGSLVREPLAQYQAALMRLGYGWRGREVYLLFGHARMDMDDSLSPASAGNAFGGGISLFGSDSVALNLNYLTLDGGTYSAASFGFRYFLGAER